MSKSWYMLTALICYFLAVVIFSLLKRKTLPGRTIYLLRALLPSWRFFEDFDEAPTLYHRYGSGPESMDEWKRCLERPERRVHHLLYNPRANYVLAAGSAVQQLLSEISESSDLDSKSIESLVSYRLVKNLASFGLSPEQITCFQFKISGTSEDLLISPIYELIDHPGSIEK